MAAKPTVIGIYGLPGSGKSFLLNQLKDLVDTKRFALVEGSSKIASLSGEKGLEGFKPLDEAAKQRIRERAIQAIGEEAAFKGHDAIVAGHYSFWEGGEPEPQRVWTEADACTYTIVIYLRVDAARIHERRRTDSVTIRPRVSVEHLKKWQDLEVQSLRGLCAQSGILFIELREQPDLACRVWSICLRYRLQSEQDNSHLVARRVDDIVKGRRGALSTVLLLDGDRTLSPEDTGRLFWTMEPSLGELFDGRTPTERLFRDQGYSLFAFQQAALLYEEALNEDAFHERCRKVAERVRLFPELEALVRKASMRQDTLVLVVTSGIVTIWELIMDDMALPRPYHVSVFGGPRHALKHLPVITPEVKGQIASRLRDVHGLDVFAFGDSPLDIHMLKVAHHAVVVVGPEESRSRSMDRTLSEALRDGLRAKQLLVPHNAPPRLDLERLPRVSVEDVMADLQRSTTPKTSLHFLHATDKEACRLLASPTRDPSIAGPDLRRATARIGHYLAIEYLSAVLGLAESPSQTVQGTPTASHSLRDEAATAVVAIMRAGEPLAEGVFDAFPRSRFIHARAPGDLTARELEGIRTVLLVDTVINTGETIIEFVRHVRGLDLGAGAGAGIKVVVVASVVQAETVREGHPMARALAGAGATLVALRVSENKYKGTKGLDTGNRMFNTTHRD